MKKKEIKKMTKSQAQKDIEKFKKDLFNLRFQKINGQVTNTSKIKETKRNIARLKTFIGAKANA
ncbi:50S ribosomal protein L29 [Candidatus Pelagibacter communis]|jgi:large subunit ribosomal protein L29|uniref:50S ribosomal protein L29 n=1 Tax=Pelagibacter ubique TaxID=198252 RepID=UPI00094CFE5F|nr:50S ribosomal protein L29 [Candidatus Pelagibacter ubique]|tara:strand:- start:1151 stop:1342 length:192 start_codon:yes stop_codon:yes gene_type:complete